jgi:hypothetical protein
VAFTVTLGELDETLEFVNQKLLNNLTRSQLLPIFSFYLFSAKMAVLIFRSGR